MIVDTGPLVALINKSDRHHKWTREVMSSVAPPLHTCEAVLSEACFLLRRTFAGQDAVLELVARKVVLVDFAFHEELTAIRKMMDRYKSIPMSLADACLVRMSELHPKSTVITLDHDFTIYRQHKRKPIPLRVPNEAG